MSDFRRKYATVMLSIIAGGLVSLSGYLLVSYAEVSVRIAFAADMTDIFAEMRARALQGNVAEGAICLEYVVNYYPSGTKLDTGSRLDRIVERDRARAVADIIAHLRRQTGEDLGDDPGTWIKKFAR